MQISEKQLALVNDRLQAILKSDNYFGQMYKEMGITEIKTPEDFYRPFPAPYAKPLKKTNSAKEKK